MNSDLSAHDAGLMFLFRHLAIRIHVKVAFAALLLAMATLSGAFAAAPDRIKQRFEFHDEPYVAKLGGKVIPGGTRPWTKAERRGFLRQVDRAYDIAPKIVEQAVLYRKIRVYRAADDRFSVMVSLVHTNELIVPEWFINPPAKIEKERRDTETLTTLVHELVHLSEPFGSLSYDDRWQELVAPRMKKVRDYFLAKGTSIDEVMFKKEYDPVAQAEGLPSVYAAFSMSEALAEVVSAMLVTKRAEIPADIQAFVTQALLKKAAKKDPAKDLAHQAMTAFETGDAELAEKLFDKANKAGADWPNFNVVRGDLWKSRMLTADSKLAPFYGVNAIILYTNAIKRAGPGYDAYVYRGRMNLVLHSYKDAAEDFTAFLAVHVNDAMVLSLRAKAYKGMGEWGKALADLDKLISRKIETAEIYQIRAEAHLGLGDGAGVIEDASKAIAFKGGANAEIYELRGRALSAENKYEEAIADFTKAIEMKKDFTSALYGRGLAYYYSGRFEPAVADLESTAALRSDVSLVYLFLGAARNKLKKWDQAETALSRALELKMNSEQNKWALLWRAEVRSGLGRDEEALEDLDTTIAANPDWTMALAQRGNTMLKLEKYDQALGDFEKVVSKNPRDVRSSVVLAKLLERAGEQARAKSLLDAARKIDAKQAEKFEQTIKIGKPN